MASTNNLDLSCAAWRTSTYSNAGGNCVEVATAWRTSTYSNNGGNCVEVEVAHASVRPEDAGSRDGGYRSAAARTGPAVAVRDSKDPDGPVLAFSPAAWHAFASVQ
jgi:hypothetical protein